MGDNFNETTILNRKIQICEDLDEYRQEILLNIVSQKELWIKKINSILKDNAYTKSQLSNLCGVSRVTINKWFKGSIPKNREMFIRIGFAANYSLEEMNNLLIRYGRYQGLYAKSLEDSICIYVLTSENLRHDYETYIRILNMVKSKLVTVSVSESEVMFDTSDVLIDLTNLHSEYELVEFIKENASIYTQQYGKLYSYILAFLHINKLNLADDEHISTHFLANGQGWSSSLRQCVSAINQRKWYPVRNKIISLGLHLNMDVEQINQMLRLAHMEELCAKNIFESAIIYALENAKLEDMIFCDGTDSLCLYVRKILEELQLEDTEFFLEELPNDY